MFLMNKLVIQNGVLFSDFTAYRTQCCQNLLWLVKFSVQPTWHALKPYDKRNRRTDRCIECSTSTHRAHRYPTIHKPSTSWVSTRFFDSPKLQGWIMSKEYQVLTSKVIKRQTKPKHVEAESAFCFSTSQVTLAQRFLEVGTELFEAIKNYDAEALIGLQKDQIFTFLQVEAQHSKLLLHSENILWYARCTIIQYRRLEVRTWFHDISCPHFHRQVARIAKQLKASQLRLNETNICKWKVAIGFQLDHFWWILTAFQVAAMAVPKASGSSPKWSHHLDAHDWRCDIAKEDLLNMSNVLWNMMKHVICNFIDLPEIAVFLTSKLLLHCTFRHRYSWCHFWGGYAAEKPQPVDIADLIQ